MLTATVFALVVIFVVVAVMVIRDATQYTPDSPLRQWATRIAVLVIITWFASGLLHQIMVRHSAFNLLTSRGFTRGIIAILLVWLVFRDEL